MANVVEQRGGENGGPVNRLDRILFTEPPNYPRSKMIGTEAMSKARMLCPLIGKMGKPELPNPPQPLELGRIDQTDDQPPVRLITPDADYIVNRITVYAF